MALEVYIKGHIFFVTRCMTIVLFSSRRRFLCHLRSPLLPLVSELSQFTSSVYLEMIFSDFFDDDDDDDNNCNGTLDGGSVPPPLYLAQYCGLNEGYLV